MMKTEFTMIQLPDSRYGHSKLDTGKRRVCRFAIVGKAKNLPDHYLGRVAATSGICN